MDVHAEAFKEEAYDILTELEATLLELEENPADAALIDRVFGAVHTIKGSGAMFGFDVISEFTHEVEAALDMVREGLVSATPELVSLILAARDKVLELLDHDGDAMDDEALRIIFDIQEFCGIEITQSEISRPVQEEEQGRTVTYRIQFNPFADIFTTGTNPLLLLAELRELGECSVIAHTENIPWLSEYNPDNCFVSWDIILTTCKDQNAIRDVFIFVEDKCLLTIDPVFDHDKEEFDDYKRLGEILLDRGDISSEELHAILVDQKKLGERLIEAEVIENSKIDAALAEQDHVRKIIKQEKEKAFSLSSIRVDANRLDHLVDLVGELVTVQARLTRKASDDHDPELLMIAESVERLTEELRDNTMSIRMVPIGTLFSRFRRLVHDLSIDLGKQVRMTTEGAATELDKTVIDQLNEPLVHIIRNAIDHGIELPEIREELGKAAEGTILLAAYHAGASVVIEITDDGAGLDAQKLREGAIEKGFVPADVELSDEECFAQIFKPGMTTVDQVTGVSGRGVGMDVVKTSIENLRGTVNINSSRREGTTFSLRLPLTLAIIDGLLVRVGTDLFVIPLSVIEECVELTRAQATISRERSMMTFRGEAFSYISLRHCFNIDEEPPEVEKVILVNIQGKKTGFSVDQVIGQHQTVIKTLSRVYGNVEGITGGTILGDGTVALILDVNQLSSAVKKDTAHWEQGSMNQQLSAA